MQSQHTTLSFNQVLDDLEITLPDLKLDFKNASLDEIETCLSSNLIPVFKLDVLKKRVEELRRETIDQNADVKKIQEQFEKIENILISLDSAINRGKPVENGNTQDAISPGPVIPLNMHPLFNKDLLSIIVSYLSSNRCICPTR